jgi:alpha-L-fucosidase 2
MRSSLKIRVPICFMLLSLCAVSAWAQTGLVRGAQLVASDDVTWHSLGVNENDSMPIGNGTLGANVWTEANGDLVLLVSSPDAWTEMGKLVKLGRVRIRLTPNPFVGSGDFTEVLRLEDGSIEIRAGSNTARIWVDANHPAIHVEAHTEHPAVAQVFLETWRKNQSLQEASAEKAGMFELGSDDYPVGFEADTILPAAKHSIAWYHFNEKSIYPTVLEQEHLSSLIGKYPDPLLHRCFGALITGTGLVSKNDRTLVSREQRDFRIDVIARMEKNAASGRAWKTQLDQSLAGANPTDLSVAWRAHQRWWQEFWNRSWIQVSGDEQAQEVSQGYAIQRYMMAASSRGELPVKFNGGMFTVGHDMPDGVSSDNENHNPDYRAWGNCYWNQNNRLLYWPLVATGDYDLLKPWFRMYLSDLPLEKDRTELYYHHPGASYPETMYFWGVPSVHDFGWDNPTDVIESRWQRYHIQGSLEVISEMLDYYDYTGDTAFAKNSIVPLADAVVTYYDRHWPRGADGKIRMSPTQSLETYQLTAVNPTPDIAGLRSILPRMLALPSNLITPEQTAAWTRTLHDLPALAEGRTAADGKTPPEGKGDPQGTKILLPAHEYGPKRNVENPELYVTFPYHLFGVGKLDLKLARDTFSARKFPQNTCWGQDGTESAALGLTEVAQQAAIAEFTNYGDERFKWFWKPAHDWIPDLDNGGSGMITLQEMLLQPNGRKLLLLPAWPDNWSADFKLHAPFETTVEGRVENGKLVRLVVTPKSRAADVVVVDREK